VNIVKKTIFSFGEYKRHAKILFSGTVFVLKQWGNGTNRPTGAISIANYGWAWN
jgi:hypothetical protein